MKKINGRGVIGIVEVLLLVLVLLAAGVVFWLISASDTETDTQTSVSVEIPADWKKHEVDNFGVSLSTPSKWTIDDYSDVNECTDGHMLRIDPTEASIKEAELNPELNEVSIMLIKESDNEECGGISYFEETAVAELAAEVQGAWIQGSLVLVDLGDGHEAVLVSSFADNVVGTEENQSLDLAGSDVMVTISFDTGESVMAKNPVEIDLEKLQSTTFLEDLVLVLESVEDL